MQPFANLKPSTSASSARCCLRAKHPCCQRAPARACASSSVPGQQPDEGVQTEEGWVPARRRRKDWTLGPSLELSPADAVHMQLQALQENNTPWVDHGIEVLYRFAAFDPFERSHYFGRSWDLGQFERFRRLARDKPYDVLLQHTERCVTSSLQVSDTRWTQRVWVCGFAGKQTAVYDFHMVRKCGGRHDGYWFTNQLLCDGVETTRRHRSGTEGEGTDASPGV